LTQLLCNCAEQLRPVLVGNHGGAAWRFWSLHCQGVKRRGSDHVQCFAAGWTG